MRVAPNSDRDPQDTFQPPDSAVVLIAIEDYTPRIRRILADEGLADVHAVYITVNEEAYFKLKHEGRMVLLAQELFSETDVSQMNAEAVAMVRERLFIDAKGRDVSLYAGRSLGDLYELYFFRPVLEAVRDTTAIEKALSVFRPQEVIVAGPGGLGFAARLVCRSKNVSCRRLLDGALARTLRSVSRVFRMRRDRWPRSVFKEVFVELALDVLIVLDAILKRMRGAYRDEPKQGAKTLVFSADPWCRPVYERLKEQGGWECYVTGTDFFMRRRAFADMRPLEGRAKIVTLLKSPLMVLSCAPIWWRMKRGPVRAGRLVSRGVDLWPLLRNTLRLMVMVGFPRVILQRSMALDAMRGLDPERTLVILPFDVTPVFRAMLSAASDCGIKGLMLQHSLLGESMGQDRLYVDYYAAWGKRTLDWYGAFGTKVKDYRLTGYPRYDDSYRNIDAVEHGSAHGRLGLHERKKFVLVVTSGGEALSVGSTAAEDIFMVADVLRALESLGMKEQYHVAVKLHPRQNQKLFKRNLANYGAELQRVFIYQENLTDLLRACDVCVGRYSTVLFEAMFFKKPCVVYDNLNKLVYVPYVEYGAALSASEVESMATALTTVFSGGESVQRMLERQQEFIRYGLEYLDSNATQRVCDYIDDIVSGRADTAP